jgi:hypothetical protein
MHAGQAYFHPHLYASAAEIFLSLPTFHWIGRFEIFKTFKIFFKILSE